MERGSYKDIAVIQGHSNNEKRTNQVYCNNKVEGISRNIALPGLKTIQGHCNNGKRTIPGQGNSGLR